MGISIIGAGISGLSLATFLDAEEDLAVFEAKEKPGGWIRTEPNQSIYRNLGANGFLNNEASMDKLIAQLGLEKERVLAADGPRYLVNNGQAVALPHKPTHLFKSPLLSFFTKIRILCEPLVGCPSQEQTVHDFLTHRLGRKAGSLLAEAMVTGVWAGDPKALSMQAAFPRIAAMVDEHGSFYKALKHQRKKAGPAPRLMSLRGGVGQLSERIAQHLGNRLHLNHSIERIEKTDDGWLLHSPKGVHSTRTLVLATPAARTAALLENLIPEASVLLRSIPTAPVAVVHHIWPADSWSPPAGFGVLIPHREQKNSLGVLYSSQIFPDLAPQGHILFRSIVGGTKHPDICTHRNEDIQQIALEDLQSFVPECPMPSKQHVVKCSLGIPQYGLGHQQRIQQLQAHIQKFPGLHVVGNYLKGVAVKDCVRTSHETALQIRSSTTTR